MELKSGTGNELFSHQKAGNIHESAQVRQLILSLTAKVEYDIDFLND